MPINMAIGVLVTFATGATEILAQRIREQVNYGPVAAKDLEGVQEVLRMFKEPPELLCIQFCTCNQDTTL